MRSIIIKGLHELYNLLLFIYFKIVSIGYSKNIYVFDIDNTLADTWISFHNYDDRVQHFERLSTLAIFINMYNIIKKIVLSKGNTIIYLTARDFRDYNVTFKWLFNNNIEVNYRNLFLVPGAYYKLKFIRLLIKRNHTITYLDDLSYNHEKGQIQYYQKIINELDLLPIRYIDYFKIQQINEGIEEL
jgi:hypothetical protein